MTLEEFARYLVDSFREDMIGDTPIAGVYGWARDEQKGCVTIDIDVQQDHEEEATMFKLEVSIVQ